MSVSVSLNPGPDGSQQLINAATRGGVVVIRLNAGGAGTFFALPQDNKRTYIGFSLTDPALPAVLSPGDDNQPFGYRLHANESIIEFGGSALAPLVQGNWRITTVGLNAVDVVIHRSP